MRVGLVKYQLLDHGNCTAVSLLLTDENPTMIQRDDNMFSRGFHVNFCAVLKLDCKHGH